MQSQNNSNQQFRPPKWSYKLFFVALIFIFIWVIPSSFRLLISDLYLSKSKYQINLWSSNKDPIPLNAWNKVNADLKYAARIAPNNPDVKLYQGNNYSIKAIRYEPKSYLMKAYFSEASDYYAAAINLKPADPLLWVNYAKALSIAAPQSNDFKDAFYNAKLLGSNELYLKRIIDTIEIKTK